MPQISQRRVGSALMIAAIGALMGTVFALPRASGAPAGAACGREQVAADGMGHGV